MKRCGGHTFCDVFCVSTICFPGQSQDFLLVTADSGNITIFDLRTRCFTELLLLPFGKTGIPRKEPGVSLAASPCGRSAMSRFLEKYKLAWTIGKTEALTPQLSAPIESSRSRCLVFGVAVLDVGYSGRKNM
jgi:hypothetical protein